MKATNRLFRLMPFIAIIVLLLCLFACSPEKRLARLVKKHPELVSQDTIFKSDTTIVYGVQRDTIFKSQITKDTITIIDKQLTIKYYNDGKTTYIKGICDTVFVVKEIPVIVNRTNPVDYKDWPWYVYVIGGVFLLMLVVILIKK